MYLLLFFPLFFWFSGFSAAQKDITGPNAVSGQERGSLTVQCRYTSKWKTSRKWWCRGAAWSSCKIQIQTDGSEKEQKKERLSIRDYQKELMFRVTLEDLRRDDADNYWCGIERFGTDPGLKVKVTVVPDLHEESLSSVRPSPTLAPSTTKTIKYQLVTTTSNSTQLETGTSAPTRSLLSNTYFLLLVFLKLPLLLSMLGIVLWVNRPQRGPAGLQNQPK
uniref:CD300 molecule like family member f n=1 Tax=Chinchilla lanigera TaxID=34839 RepID=A0A8C2UU67_CHILA